MTTVAMGTKNPSHSSNVSLKTVGFLMKGPELGGKRTAGNPLPWKPNLLLWQPKKRSFVDQFGTYYHGTLNESSSVGREVNSHASLESPQSNSMWGDLCPPDIESVTHVSL